MVKKLQGKGGKEAYLIAGNNQKEHKIEGEKTQSVRCR